MIYESLLCMGDSITRGARTYLGYPELAAGLLSGRSSSQWSSWNFAWNGYRAVDLLRAIDERGADLARFNTSLATVMIGTNDAKEGTSPEPFAMAMEQIVLKAGLFAQRGHVMVLGIPALAPGMSLPYNASMNTRIDTYNDLLKRIAERNGRSFLQLHCEPEDLIDGVHLSEVGVSSFARQLCDRILQDRGSNG